MKRFMAGFAVLAMFTCSTIVAQELSIGPVGGALFMQGSHGNASAMHGMGSSYSLGGQVVYSMDSAPLDFIGQASYVPMGGHYHRGDSLAAPEGHEGHGGSGASLFSFGLGGRWVPLRGSVSPYLGVSILLSHQEGPGQRGDSTHALTEPAGSPGPSDEAQGFGQGGGVTRLGVGLSVGSKFALSSLITLDVGASYSLNSPFERGGNLSTIGFGASVLFTLF